MRVVVLRILRLYRIQSFAHAAQNQIYNGEAERSTPRYIEEAEHSDPRPTNPKDSQSLTMVETKKPNKAAKAKLQSRQEENNAPDIAEDANDVQSDSDDSMADVGDEENPIRHAPDEATARLLQRERTMPPLNSIQRSKTHITSTLASSNTTGAIVRASSPAKKLRR